MIKTLAKALSIQKRRFDAGKCGTSKAVRRFVMAQVHRDIHQYLLIIGGMDILWKGQKRR